MNRSRREFLEDVGRGMLVAGFGSALAADLGLAPAWAAEDVRPLAFGSLEPLVARMQQTPVEKLLPDLVQEIKAGTDLKTLVAAGALANARTFGGQDYTGFHTLMALAPAYSMAGELPSSHQALPVLKVLYRNTSRIQQAGGRKNEVLHEIHAELLESNRPGGELLQAATRSADFDRAERTFAAFANEPVGEAFNHLQYAIQDELNVHRVVLAWRAWALLDLAGGENAHTLLRQSVRFCVDAEQERIGRGRPEPAIRKVLPKLLDQYKLVGRSLGQRHLNDAELNRLAAVIYAQQPEQAADAVAAALADHIAPGDLADAISLAANRLVLHDPGRRNDDGKDRPAGSVHGASVGVHASDAANAWRNIALVSNPRNTVASLIAGAYHTAGQSGSLNDQPYPLPEHREAVTSSDPAALLQEADAAIQANDQARACAVIDRYGRLGHEPRAAFDVLLGYATSEDGALHAEKYYHTVCEEFARARPALRWQYLVALARVTASQHGHAAPGYNEARDLLGLA